MAIKHEVTVDCNHNRYCKVEGKLHRELGPAVEWANGTKLWYSNDELHCVDGPEIGNVDSDKFWYLKGKKLSEPEFDVRRSFSVRNPIAVNSRMG